MTYFKPFARWASKRGLMKGGFGELERPAQAQKKQLALSHADVAALLRSLGGLVPRHRRQDDAHDRRTLNEVCLATWREIDLEKCHGRCPDRDERTSGPAD